MINKIRNFKGKQGVNYNLQLVPEGMTGLYVDYIVDTRNFAKYEYTVYGINFVNLLRKFDEIT